MTRREISLVGLTFYAHHGAYRREKIVGQPFVVDLTVAYDFAEAARTDRLKDAIDYRGLYGAVSAVVEGEGAYRLIEAMAEAIGRRVLDGFPAVSRVRVRVQKPWAPLGGLSSRTEAVFEEDRD